MKRILLILPPLLIAGLVVLVMRSGEGDDPLSGSRDGNKEQATAVAVVTLEARSVTPLVTGFGRVAPARTWQAVAQVSGRVTALHNNLGAGSTLAAGTEVITIDDTDYQRAYERAKVNLKSSETDIAELALSEKNLKTSLALERRSLAIDQADLERKKDLAASGSISQTQIDTADKALIQQQKSVLAIENSLSLLPVQRSRLESAHQLQELNLHESKQALDNTHISIPFDARVKALNVQIDQYVRSGEVLASFEGLGDVEIIAEVAPESLRNFLRLAMGEGVSTDFKPRGNDWLLDLMQSLDVRSSIILEIGGEKQVWPAELIRLSGTLDEATGTLGFIVRPGDDKTGGQKPALINGALVEVHFEARAVADQFVLPGNAIHVSDQGNSQLFRLGQDNRLEIVPVRLGSALGTEQVILSGVKAGETYVTSALPFVAEGMKLIPKANGKP